MGERLHKTIGGGEGAMNILVINGSPKGLGSNSYRLTEAFLEGMKQTIPDMQTRELSVSRMDI